MNIRGDFLGSPHSTNTTALIFIFRKIKDLEGLVDKQKHLTEKEKRQKEETEKRWYI